MNPEIVAFVTLGLSVVGIFWKTGQDKGKSDQRLDSFEKAITDGRLEGAKAIDESKRDREDLDRRLRVVEGLVPALVAKDEMREGEVKRIENQINARMDRLEGKLDLILARVTSGERP